MSSDLLHFLGQGLVSRSRPSSFVKVNFLAKASFGFSFVRTLRAWHCPHSPAAAAKRRAHSSKPAAVGLLLWANAGTDRWTDTVPLH